MTGWDTDTIWLVTDRITLGANWSYVKSEHGGRIHHRSDES
jgi:hypothetical protein